MAVLAKVLGLVVVILATFMVWIKIVPPSIQQQHNIGCYLVPHSLNQTSQLYSRIARAKADLTPISFQHRSIAADEAAFSSKVLSVAITFDKYIKQMAHQLEMRQQDREVVLAIKSAEESYLGCKREIETTISSEQCLANWHTYESCFQRVGKVQSDLDKLIQKEKTLQKAISAQIDKPPLDPEDDPEVIAERKYNESMRVNEAALEQLRGRLIEVQRKYNLVKQMKDKAEDRLQTKDRTYKECWQNRRIYRQCEEISEQVKNLNLGTLRQLKLQVEAKERLMTQMREMILRMGRGDNRKLPDHWSQMYQTHRREYKQMLKDYIYYNTQMERKACGCSEQEELNYEAEVNQEKTNIKVHNSQLQQLIEILTKLRNQLQEREEKRESIIREYQQALRKYADNLPEPRESELIRLKRQLQTNRNSILHLQHSFNEIDRQCQDIKKKIAVSVKDIDRVEECLTKKEYLIKLRQETKQYLQPQRSLVKLFASKDKLRQALMEFEH